MMKKGFWNISKKTGWRKGIVMEGAILCRLTDVSFARPVCRTSIILTAAAVADDDNL
jgi:hypothetical protein